MQTRATDQASFILRRREWRNSSLILDLLTRDYGCISLLAKGARSGPGKAAYQPFVLLSLGWSGRQELKTLTSIDARPQQVDERNYLALLYINELISCFLPWHEASPRIFDAYYLLLQQARDPLDEIDLREFEIELMRHQGYLPELGLDAESGESVRSGEHYQFVIGRGFVGCAQSADDSVDGQLILDWISGDYADNRVRRLAKSVLRSTIDFNLHGKALKSRDVYQEIIKRK